MDRAQRAKQFAPFDALKGLHEALRIKEFEHESLIKGDISEEQALKISNVMLELEKGDNVRVKYLINGHEIEQTGCYRAILEDNNIQVGEIKIDLSNLRDIEKE